MDYLKSSSRTTSRRMLFFTRDQVIPNSKLIFLLIDEVQRSMYDAYEDSSSFSLCTRDEVLRYPSHYLGIIQISSYWRSMSALMIICIVKRRAHSVSHFFVGRWEMKLNMTTLRMLQVRKLIDFLMVFGTL